MTLQLNTSTSIIDALKAQNKPSDFSSRKSLYESSGLADRLGPYVSSGSQNIAFLKSLNTPTQTQAIQPVSSVDTSSFTPEQLTAFNNAKTLIPGQTPTTSPAAPPTTSTEPTIGTSGITATQAAGSIPQAPTAEEVMNTVLNSSGFQNFMQRNKASTLFATGEAEAQKALLESKSSAATKDFINSMGRRGLFFSGETEGGIQALAESLATSKLGVDRALAKDLLDADFNTRDEILKQVEGIVKDAQQGRKEAISALEKVGLTVVGDQVVPTLAAQSADRAERNALLAQQREERLQISSDRSYQLAIEAGNRAAASANKGTAEERVQSTVSEYASRFVAGATLPNGIPILDVEGKLTPEAFQAAIADAPAEGLSREKFLTNFGYLIVGADGSVSTVYGLTPAEMKLVGAEARQ